MSDNDPIQPSETAEKNLLSPQERVTCQQYAAGEAPYSQRALALLALDEGASQVEASERSGLSVGQVRYWLPRFKKQRLDIFPEQMATAEESEQMTEEAESQPADNGTVKAEKETVAVKGIRKQIRKATKQADKAMKKAKKALKTARKATDKREKVKKKPKTSKAAKKANKKSKK